MPPHDVTTLSDECKIAIPEAIRSAHGWEPGQEFALIPKGRALLLVPVPELSDLFGLAKGADTPSYRDRSDRF